MAVTISVAVVGALVLTLTLIPVLCSYFFRRPPSERESPLLRWLRAPYTPAIRFCVRRPLVPLAVTTALLAISLVVFTLLGKEFLPELDPLERQDGHIDRHDDEHGEREGPRDLDGGVLHLANHAGPGRLVLGEVAHDVLGHDHRAVHDDPEVDGPEREQVGRNAA